MALNVTQCPSCESTFNTSARMLDAAHGLVRCGACLSVFEANENFVNALPPASNDESSTGENESVFISGQEDYFDPASFLERSDLLVEDEPDQVDESPEEIPTDSDLSDVEPDVAVTPDTTTQTEPESSSAEGENSSEYQFENSFIELPETNDDGELTSEEIVTDDDHEADSQLLEYSLIDADSDFKDQIDDDVQIISLGDADFEIELLDAEDASDAELETDEQIDNDNPETVSVENIQAPYENVPEPDLDNLAFIQQDKEPLTEEAQTTEAANEEPQEFDVSDETAESSVEELQPHQETESKEEILAMLSTSELHESDSELDYLSDENLAAIGSVDQSLELDQARPAKSLKRSLLWFSAGLFLVGLLAVQFFWQRMEIFSVDARYRPAYEFACRIANCDLPPMQDLANIQTENLVIRSHPEIANSLELTAVFRNSANFQQPFPIIELSFSDINSQPIASREFTPEEYLPEALRAIRNMPVGSPVQITLEFVDPGETAVNYSLDFRPFPIQQ